jgi:hypothetical protein
MNNEIQVFRNAEINAAIRTVMRGGEPWFVAVDVCRTLRPPYRSGLRMNPSDLHQSRCRRPDLEAKLDEIQRIHGAALAARVPVDTAPPVELPKRVRAKDVEVTKRQPRPAFGKPRK